MSYKIECVIQEIEISADGKVTGLKIKGTEGYLLKQGDNEYNVFCPEKMPEKETKTSETALILHAASAIKLKTAADAACAESLVQAKCANKKVRLKIKIDTSKESLINPESLDVESVAIT
ncbi:MAG: hypothetical protein IKC23_05000 [Fibrobacter sp.]|nr:hypothetical protein [Fibrobacter sp.]MBR2898962.1 hypothetical protein [Fibrobacter sp.]